MSAELVPLPDYGNGPATLTQTAIVDGWVRMLPAVADLSERIATTEFVPAALRNKPAAVAAAILAGREAGIGPMTALSHMHVVEGRPRLSAEMARALVLAHGHEIRFDETTTQRCIIAGRRSGSREWTEASFTMDDARRAELSGKWNWRHYPQDMLIARATGRLCRMIFSDCLAGMSVLAEEAQDGDVIALDTDENTHRPDTEENRPAKRGATAQRRAGKTTARPAPAKDTGRRAPTQSGVVGADTPEPTPAGPPPLPHEIGGEQTPPPPDRPAADAPPPSTDSPGEHTAREETAAGPKTITKAQQSKLHAAFTELGYGPDDRETRLRVAAHITNHPGLASSTELTRDEASALIDTLARIAEQPDPHAYLEDLIEST